jgi:hypothetical protein
MKKKKKEKGEKRRGERGEGGFFSCPKMLAREKVGMVKFLN